MKLITKKLRSEIPPLYFNDEAGKPNEDVEIHAKLFDPQGSWTYFIAEYDGDDIIWGYATFQDGFGEWGYSSLSEIEASRGRFGLPMERDRHFTRRKAADIDMIRRAA